MSKRFYSKKSERLATESHEAYRAGKEETDLHEIRRLEEKLRTDHTDVITRSTLLGFYSVSKLEQATGVWCTHAEWVIKNCPDEKLIKWVLAVPESVPADQFEKLKECFLKKVKRNPKNANVAGNAAYFIWLRDDLQLTKKLLKKARRLAPDNYQWSSILCCMYSYEARLTNDANIAAKAFKVGNKYIRHFEKVPHHRIQVFEVITHLCKLALKMEDFKLTEKYIKELKNSDFDSISPSDKHYFRGMLALKESNIERAKAQILKFAKKRGHLRDFTLANQLLERGEVQTVVEYLETCLPNEYDEKKAKVVAHWIKQLKKGQKVTLGFPRGFVYPLWDF